MKPKVAWGRPIFILKIDKGKGDWFENQFPSQNQRHAKFGWIISNDVQKTLNRFQVGGFTSRTRSWSKTAVIVGICCWQTCAGLDFYLNNVFMEILGNYNVPSTLYLPRSTSWSLNWENEMPSSIFRDLLISESIRHSFTGEIKASCIYVFIWIAKPLIKTLISWIQKEMTCNKYHRFCN